MSTYDYPVSLAVEDFAPVLFTTAGVLLLSRILTPARAVPAAALIGAGGSAKATAKLIAATGGPDLPWLRDLLFPLLSLGFGLLCLALGRQRTGETPRWMLLLVPGLIMLCGLGAILAADPIPLLVSTTVFATIAGVHLIALARARGDTATAALFGTQLLVFFILGPLASRPDQTVALQWVEQLCNTAAQAAFLLAAWRLPRAPAPAPADPDKEMIR
ncbi:hypothetical protein [Nocardia inohanensis]|uniref:hypothetical protein n=1 Tax=Nocardia inohanensis TaxID=209246 RepID=UPI0008336EE7|nr:hypothetical protein [Nocardia inohanensis]